MATMSEARRVAHSLAMTRAWQDPRARARMVAAIRASHPGPKPLPVFKCGWCHCEFARRSSKRRPPKYCSPACNSASQQTGARKERTCICCGEKFRAYDQTSGPRKYCSWRCAGIMRPANAGMVIQSAVRFEYELQGIFIADGWRCQRVTRSQGPFDLVAWDGNVLLLIQVKSTNNARSRSFLGYCRKAVKRLHEGVAPPWVQKFVYVKHLPSGSWSRIRVDQWPHDSAGVYGRLRKELGHAA